MNPYDSPMKPYDAPINPEDSPMTRLWTPMTHIWTSMTHIWTSINQYRRFFSRVEVCKFLEIPYSEKALTPLASATGIGN